MRSRIIRSLAWGFAASVTGMLVLLALVAWRMSQGPVALDFLVPPIERALSQPDRGLHVRVDRVVVDSIGFLQLQAEGVRIVDDAGMTVVGTPWLRLSLSSRALARGIVAPHEVELAGVRVRLSRSETGAVQLGFDQPPPQATSAGPAPPSQPETDDAASADGDVAWFIADLLSPPDPERVTGYLRRISVADAVVVVRDARLRRSWRIPDASFELIRDQDEVAAQIGGLLDVDGRLQRTDLDLHLDLATGHATVDVGLVDVRPAVVTQILPVLGFLSAFEAPISGKLSFRISRRGDIEKAEVRLDAGQGAIGVPGLGAGRSGTLPLDRMTLRGTTTGIDHFTVSEFSIETGGERIAATGDMRWSSDGSRAGLRFEGLRPALLAPLSPWFAEAAGIDIALDGWAEFFMPGGTEPASVAFGVQSDGGQVTLPERFDEPLRISRLALRGAADLAQGRLRIDRFSLGLGGPQVEGDATMRTVHGGAVIQADVTARDVPTDSLPSLWPKGVSKGAREWVLDHLSGGGVSEAKARLALVLAEGPRSVPMVSVNGSMRMHDITAVYWDPLPAFEQVSGSATFTEDRFDLRVDGGRYGNIVVDGGEMAFTNLSDGLDREFADITVDLHGPLSEIITVLDRPPLGYAKWLGVEPPAVGGQAQATLHVQLPLLQDVQLEQIEIDARGALSGVHWPDAALGQPLEQAELMLRLDKESLDLVGRGRLAGAPVEMTLHELFSGGTTLWAKTVVDGPARTKLGLDTAPYILGPVPVRLTMTGTRAKSEIRAQAELNDATLALSEGGWRKPPGLPGSAAGTLILEGGDLERIEDFTLQAPGALVAGDAAGFTPGRIMPDHLNLPRLRLGERTDLALKMNRTREGGWRVDARGASLDLEPLIKGADEPEDAVDGGTEPRGAEREEGPPVSIVADIARVWASDTLPIDGVSGHLSWHAGTLDDADLRGSVAGLSPVALLAGSQPAEGSSNEHRVSLTGRDFGSTIRALGLYDTVVGGPFRLTAVRDAAPGSPYSGSLEVGEFRVVRAPFIARLFASASFIGLADLASADEGITFTELSAPFAFGNDQIVLHPGRAFGPAVGITWRGEIDLEQEKLDVGGTLVPFYSVNRFLGAIPLLGDVLTGGEGGGLFAVTYGMQGDLEEPELSVNPLSLLAPGFLRDLFMGAGGGGNGGAGAETGAARDPARSGLVEKAD